MLTLKTAGSYKGNLVSDDTSITSCGDVLDGVKLRLEQESTSFVVSLQSLKELVAAADEAHAKQLAGRTYRQFWDAVDRTEAATLDEETR